MPFSWIPIDGESIPIDGKIDGDPWDLNPRMVWHNIKFELIQSFPLRQFSNSKSTKNCFLGDLNNFRNSRSDVVKTVPQNPIKIFLKKNESVSGSVTGQELESYLSKNLEFPRIYCLTKTNVYDSQRSTRMVWMNFWNIVQNMVQRQESRPLLLFTWEHCFMFFYFRLQGFRLCR